MRNLKKVILVFGLCLFISCSKDNSNEEVVSTKNSYEILTSSDCPKVSKSVLGNYIVTKETYDYIKPKYESAGGCYFWVSFKDINNVKRSGYIRGIAAILH